MLPPDRKCNALYLRPLVRYGHDVWFRDAPIGINPLQGTVKRLGQQAGFHDYLTNHPFRATGATRMYQANMSEQVIQEITGHRS